MYIVWVNKGKWCNTYSDISVDIQTFIQNLINFSCVRELDKKKLAKLNIQPKPVASANSFDFKKQLFPLVLWNHFYKSLLEIHRVIWSQI